MVRLIVECLFYELFQTLDVLFINNLGEYSESIRFDHVVVTLLDVLAQAGDNNKYFIFIDFQFLDKYIDQSPQIKVHSWGHLEKLGNIEKHG